MNGAISTNFDPSRDLVIFTYRLRDKSWVRDDWHFAVYESKFDRWTISPEFGAIVLEGKPTDNAAQLVNILIFVREYAHTVYRIGFNDRCMYGTIITNYRLGHRMMCCGDLSYLFPHELSFVTGQTKAVMIPQTTQTLPKLGFRMGVRGGQVVGDLEVVLHQGEYVVKKTIDVKFAKIKWDRQKILLMGSNHKNVIKVTDLVESGAHRVTAYSRWCAGGTLDASGRQFLLPKERASVLRDVLNGLLYLNTKMNMLHLDVKESNMFIDIQNGSLIGVIGDIVRGVHPSIVIFDCVWE